MINDNDIKRILEESDNIKVPEKISQGIDNTLSTIKAPKTKTKNKKYKKNKKMLIAASVAALVLIGTTYTSDSVGAAINKVINKVEDLFKITTDGDDIEGVNLNDYKTVIGSTVEDKGIKVTLNEFFMEDDRMYINVALDSKAIDDYARHIEAHIFINGKRIDTSSISAFSFGDYKQSIENEKNKEKYLVLEYKMDSIDVSTVKDVKIEFKYVNAMKKEYLGKPYNMKIKAEDMVNYIHGKWNFAFSYDGKKMQDKIVTKLIGETIDIDGNFKVYIDKVKITPVSVTVRYKKYGDNNTEGSGLGLNVINKNNNMENYYESYGLMEDTYSYTRFDVITEGMDKITIVPAIDNGYHGTKYFKDKALVVENK